MNRRQRRFALAATLAVAGLLALASRVELLRRAEARLSRVVVAAPLDTRNRLRDQLRRAGQLHPQPPRDLAATARVDARGRCPDPEFGPAALAAEAMPSSVIAPREAVASGAPVVALWLEPCRLRRLQRLRQWRGRDFEELGWLSVFDGGELRFASAVGVRVHGGRSRLRPPLSYRIYFRGALGERRLPAALLDGELAGGLDRVVLKHDDGLDEASRPFPMVDPMALEVARLLGAPAPRTRPVRMSLNGAPPRLYYLVEPIAGEFLARRFGHGEFERISGKVERASPEARRLAAEQRWLAAQPVPLRAAQVATRYDLDGLTTSLLTALFVGAGDAFQDALVRDRRGVVAGGRWTPVPWDLDFAFRQRPHSARRFGGHDDLLPYLLDPVAPPPRLLAQLLHRLLREDEAFRAAVARRLDAALARELAPGELAALVERYERTSAALGITDREFFVRLRQLFARRPDELRRQAERYLGAGDTAQRSRATG